MPIRIIASTEATNDVYVALALTTALVAHEGYEMYTGDTEGRPIFLILPCLGVGYCLIYGTLTVNHYLMMGGLGLFAGLTYERYRASNEPKKTTGLLAATGLAIFLYCVYHHS